MKKYVIVILCVLFMLILFIPAFLLLGKGDKLTKTDYGYSHVEDNLTVVMEVSSEKVASALRDLCKSENMSGYVIIREHQYVAEPDADNEFEVQSFTVQYLCPEYNKPVFYVGETDIHKFYVLVNDDNTLDIALYEAY